MKVVALSLESERCIVGRRWQNQVRQTPVTSFWSGDGSQFPVKDHTQITHSSQCFRQSSKGGLILTSNSEFGRSALQGNVHIDSLDVLDIFRDVKTTILALTQTLTVGDPDSRLVKEETLGKNLCSKDVTISGGRTNFYIHSHTPTSRFKGRVPKMPYVMGPHGDPPSTKEELDRVE